MTKYIIVTGGVISGLGKGVLSGSISSLLNQRYKVVHIKFDGYLNPNSGTMNPGQHGEVYVTKDGREADLDFGHYERFGSEPATTDQSITGGSLYEDIIQIGKEGTKYPGQTLRMVPHVQEILLEKIFATAKKKSADICMIEVGGIITHGETAPIMHALKILPSVVGPNNVFYAHTVATVHAPRRHTQVPQIKTSPAQEAVAQLLIRSIIPDMIVVRTDEGEILTYEHRKKISGSLGVDRVIHVPCLDTIYAEPLTLLEEKVDDLLRKKLDINVPGVAQQWRERVYNLRNPTNKGDPLIIALCGKYMDGDEDSYISVTEALQHAAAARKLSIDVKMINTEDTDINEQLAHVDGVIVPGGYGSRGIDGKIAAIRYARENNVPFLGLCYGMQLAVVEYARNMCNKEGAHTTEVNEHTPHPVVKLLPEQQSVTMLSGTQRLGAQTASLRSGSLVAKLYGATTVSERHRHRYEVNPAYHAILESNGLAISGVHADNPLLAEFIELPQHPYFVGTQAHPEFQSRFLAPAPLFQGLVDAAYERKKHN